MRYLERHFPIISGWAAWHWMQYMQRRNPTTPALANKLFAPTKREALTKQSRYWRAILASEEGARLCCIYSGERLRVDAFALDHYLPWSFVAHDQLWNLIPAPASVNSAKSNNLPSEVYLERFVDLQHQGLCIASREFKSGQFAKLTEDYLADLHLPSIDALLDHKRLEAAYIQTLGPLVTLATNQGFAPDWTYAPTTS